MAFSSTQSDGQQQTSYTKNPWVSFKGADGKFDKFHSAHRIRFLDDWLTMNNQVALSHWDGDIKRKVECGRRIWKDFSSGEFKLTKLTNCHYCMADKAVKDEWQNKKDLGDPSVENQKYAPRPYQLDVNMVGRVAVLNKETKVQVFALAALPAKDMLFTTGKGVYKLLQEFDKNARAEKDNPTDLSDYWWDYAPKSFSNVPGRVGDVTEAQKEVVPNGLFNEDDEEFDMANAAPFDYAKAMEMRDQLANANTQKKSYDAYEKTAETATSETRDQASENVLNQAENQAASRTKHKAKKSDEPKASFEGTNGDDDNETDDFDDDDIPPF